MGFSAAAAGAVLGSYGAYQGASAQKDALNFNADVAGRNADFSGWQAQQVARAGGIQEQNQRLKTAALAGDQRLALAANGVDIGQSGSAQDVLSSTAYMGERDALTIRDNTAMQVYGYKRQQANYLSEAAQYRKGAGNINPSLAAAGSLLGSASQLKFPG